MSDAILQIILAAITLIGVVITSVVAPLLKSKLTKEQRDNIVFWTEIAVVAIEKHFENTTGEGAIKKEMVVEFLMTNLDLEKYMSKEQISIIIDAVVEEIINKA